METAAETKVQFEEFLKAEDFEEKITAICEQAEITVNSAETSKEMKSRCRRYLISLKDLYGRTIAKYVAQKIVQQVIQDLIQRASDSCDLIKAHNGGLLQWKS